MTEEQEHPGDICPECGGRRKFHPYKAGVNGSHNCPTCGGDQQAKIEKLEAELAQVRQEAERLTKALELIDKRWGWEILDIRRIVQKAALQEKPLW